jgi:hypothetical protein
MKADIGPKDSGNAIIFCQDADGPYVKVIGPDAAFARKSKDSPAPKRKVKGRLVDRRPRVVKLDVRAESIARLEASA